MTGAPAAAPVAARARALVAEHPVFDAHVDSLQRSLDLGHDLGERTPGHLDLVRGRAGGLGAVVLVCWVDPAYIDPARGGAFRRTRALLAEFHALAARHPDRIAFAGNGAQLERARAAGAVAGIPGVEGGHSIEASLEKLEWLFDHGVRVLTLVWNNSLTWVRSCRDDGSVDAPAGLSEFGREVVARMNELGMVVDLSHAADAAVFDALEVSRAPVIASHSGCRAVNEHPRNLTDEQLRALAARGGVVGVVFHPGFLDRAAADEEARVRASDAYRALSAADDTALFLAQSQLLEREAAPFPAGKLVDHVVHAASVAGVEHVGIGSDFDGIQRGPAGLADASCYGHLAELLLARGFSDDEVRAVLGGNMRRVFAHATGPGTRAATASLAPLEREASAKRPVVPGE